MSPTHKFPTQIRVFQSKNGSRLEPIFRSVSPATNDRVRKLIQIHVKTAKHYSSQAALAKLKAGAATMVHAILRHDANYDYFKGLRRCEMTAARMLKKEFGL